MKNSHAINGSLENLYTLDPQDIPETNDEELARMKKYMDAVIDTVLTEKQKSVLIMYHGEGKKTPEIADILGVTPRDIQKTLGSTMAKLKLYKKIFLKSEH